MAKRTNRMRGNKIKLLGWAVILAVLAAACAGPEDRDDADPTATQVAQQPTFEQAVEPSPSLTATTEPSPTPGNSPTPTVSPTATSSPTPVPPTNTPAPTVTATALPLSLGESLPRSEDLPGEGYFLANQGSRSALELANSYSDPSAHLERLNDWGFQEHLFREYGREGEDPALPFYVLTTVNEYGDKDLASEALEWLRALNASLGQTFVEPDPDLADGAFASSVQTAEGSQTAIVYVQMGPRIYAYFAQGGTPLDFVMELAQSNTAVIEGAG